MFKSIGNTLKGIFSPTLPKPPRMVSYGSYPKSSNNNNNGTYYGFSYPNGIQPHAIEVEQSFAEDERDRDHITFNDEYKAGEELEDARVPLF